MAHDSLWSFDICQNQPLAPVGSDAEDSRSHSAKSDGFFASPIQSPRQCVSNLRSSARQPVYNVAAFAEVGSQVFQLGGDRRRDPANRRNS
jgi:hypothetical protein